MVMIADKISDFISRVKNVSLVGKKELVVPYASKVVYEVAQAMKRLGFLDAVKEETNELHISVSYKNEKPVMKDAKRVSHLSRRVYTGVQDIFKFERGNKKAILSTPAGVLTGKEAIDKKVGGEVLIQIW